MMATHDHSRVENQSHSQNTTLQTEDVIVVMVPLPAQAHLNQLLHLSRLIASYNIPVHYVFTPSHALQAKLRVHGWDPLSIPNIHFHEFPVPSYQTPPPSPNEPTRFPTQIMPAFFASVHLHTSQFFSLMQELSSTTKRLVVIHDYLIRYVIQNIGSIPNAESYTFHCTSSFNFYVHVWKKEGKPEVPEFQILQRLPESSYPEELNEFLRLQLGAKLINSGDLFNSFRALEGTYLDHLADSKMSDMHNNWAIGPFNPVLINEKESSKNRHYCLAWLDKQAPNSVIFVSFGTTTSLTDEQVKEIAIGLEKSEQKFLWAIRNADKGDIFKGVEGWKARLPEGFESRIEGRGIIVRDWAPQLEILAHSSTGGFLSHCGWNSCMESISHGVPIAAWPIHSDQPRNAALIAELLKIGLIIRDGSLRDEVVASKTVKNAVRRLMASAEGDEMRQRAQALVKSMKGSIWEGASRLEMDSFIAHICR